MRRREPLPLPFCSLPKGDPDGAAGSDMASPLKLYYLAPNVILLSLRSYITFH